MERVEKEIVRDLLNEFVTNDDYNIIDKLQQNDIEIIRSNNHNICCSTDDDNNYETILYKYKNKLFIHTYSALFENDFEFNEVKEDESNLKYISEIFYYVDALCRIYTNDYSNDEIKVDNDDLFNEYLVCANEKVFEEIVHKYKNDSSCMIIENTQKTRHIIYNNLIEKSDMFKNYDFVNYVLFKSEFKGDKFVMLSNISNEDAIIIKTENVNEVFKHIQDSIIKTNNDIEYVSKFFVESEYVDDDKSDWM